MWWSRCEAKGHCWGLGGELVLRLLFPTFDQVLLM